MAKKTGESPFCPKCNTNNTWKYGIIYLKDGKKQKYFCRSCNKYFSI